MTFSTAPDESSVWDGVSGAPGAEGALVAGGASDAFTLPLWAAARSAPECGAGESESCPRATAGAQVMSHRAAITGASGKRRRNADVASSRISVNGFIALPGSSFE
jgi:hypothetical protein